PLRNCKRHLANSPPNYNLAGLLSKADKHKIKNTQTEFKSFINKAALKKKQKCQIGWIKEMKRIHEWIDALQKRPNLLTAIYETVISLLAVLSVVLAVYDIYYGLKPWMSVADTLIWGIFVADYRWIGERTA
ncbi:MAG: hypothetical protein ACI3W5_15345, partial [Faecousia sp.]